jgi:pimeloyl-ACP methyl ester carboxylesterase
MSSSGATPRSSQGCRKSLAPTLLIVGEHDVADIHRIADIIERDVPNVRRESIPGGHHPNLDSPARFNELVLSFLDQS